MQNNHQNHLNNPLISVVIPVYNMEKYLERCIDSILCQTYDSLEIILVDDCSTDKSAKLIQEYAASDERIKTVRHDKNRGLFQARITGSELATGKYIAFVDSDDHVSVDWFRTLVRQAERSGSDIVVGEWCFDTNGEHKDYVNMDHFRIRDYSLEGREVLDAFMAVQFRNFSWSVVWNKLYSKALWDTCYPYYVRFSQEHGHMIMWEDIAFSSALFAHAKKLTNVHGVNYYYYKHENNATKINKNKAKNTKYICDSSAAIRFMAEVLRKTGVYEQYEKDYLAWKSNGMSLVYRDLVENLNVKAYKEPILTAFCCTTENLVTLDEDFYTVTTPLHHCFQWNETIKSQIVSDKIQYVSFDVFDTLVQRPFLRPTDLFELLNEQFNKDYASAYVNFKKIREYAEQMVRSQRHINTPSREDITLDDIYQYIEDSYTFDPEQINRIKALEIELELRYCTQRKAGKDLYDLALESGKTVIICSDMYLPSDVIAKILETNGYKQYHKLYVSCELELTKAQKSLFRYVQKDLGCKNEHAFLHIGDNYGSDVDNPRQCGWNSGHLTKASDLLLNWNPSVYSGEMFQKLFFHQLFKEDYHAELNNYPATRAMCGLIANKIFDNPFVSFHPSSDFNADPRLVGYAALGPHLLALCNWIHKIAKRENIGTVHFVARDGYLVKKAFDQMGYPDVKTNYIRLSRKALMLADVNHVQDLYSLYSKMNIQCKPMRIAEYLTPIIPEDKTDQVETILATHGIKWSQCMKSHGEWEQCMKVFTTDIIDMELLPAYKEKLRAYFAEFVSPGDYIFDIGYSGRPESALSNLLGFPVGSMYIHKNECIAGIRQAKYNCPAEVFYEFKPCITGVIREHLLMELGPSTVGYKDENGKLTPQLEEYESCYTSDFITKIAQEQALEFVKDYVDNFHDFDIMFNFQNEVMSAPLEYYLHFSKWEDRRIFTSLLFEDDVNGSHQFKALDYWNQELACRNMGNMERAILPGGGPGDIIPGLLEGGYLMKFILFVNRILPRGGKAREVMKKIFRFFKF